MKAQKKWHNLTQVLRTMESTGENVVLRNYEDLSNTNYYMNGHNDIDFLCSNSKNIKRILDTRKDVFWSSKDHVWVNIKGRKVLFGLRYVGDGYYDPIWEQDMINRRKIYKNDIYVLSDDDYFYSLLYHAILQKRTFFDDYQTKLGQMGREIGIFANTEIEYLEVLFEWMNKHGYKCTYPLDPTAPAYFEKIPDEYKDIIIGYKEWKIRQFFFKPVRLLGRIDRKIKRIIKYWEKV